MVSALSAVTPGIDFPNDSSITRQDLYDAIANALYGGFSRLHAAATASIPTIGTTAPSTALVVGELWVDTNTTPAQIKSWSGSAFVNTSYFIGTAAPSSTTAGTGWYDTTLKVWRVYDTIDSLAGYHPQNGAYQLWTNVNASTVAANRVVVQDTSADNLRKFDTTTAEKHQLVIGVTMESVATAAAGVIAIVGGGATVTLQVDPTAATGDIRRGDALVTYTSAGLARSAGALPKGGSTSQTKVIIGVYLGAFAEAMTERLTAAGAGTIKARLLGQVGTGAHVMLNVTNAPILSDTTPATSSTAIDVTATASGTSGAQNAAGTALMDTRHAPLAAADLSWSIVGSHGAPITPGVVFTKDGSTDAQSGASFTQSDATPTISSVIRTGWQPVSIGSGTAASNTPFGTKVFYTASGVPTTVTSWALFLNGYLC